MEPAIAQVVSVAADALSLVVLVASAAVLLTTARERETHGPRSARRICLLISGFLVASSLAEALDGWALATSCMAFLLSVQAIALAFGQLPPLRSLLDRREQAGEEAWWGEFERDFERHVSDIERSES